jgi:hypothetical protein
MAKSQTKGKNLEKAIEDIEKLIFETDPSLSKADFKIIPNYKPNHSYEIDLYA